MSQGIGVVAVLVAAGDHEDALHDLLLPRVDDLALVPFIGQQRREFLADSRDDLGLSQQKKPAIAGDLRRGKIDINSLFGVIQKGELGATLCHGAPRVWLD